MRYQLILQVFKFHQMYMVEAKYHQESIFDIRLLFQNIMFSHFSLYTETEVFTFERFYDVFVIVVYEYVLLVATKY